MYRHVSFEDVARTTIEREHYSFPVLFPPHLVHRKRYTWFPAFLSRCGPRYPHHFSLTFWATNKSSSIRVKLSMISNKCNFKRKTRICFRAVNKRTRLCELFDTKRLSILLLNRRSTITALCKFYYEPLLHSAIFPSIILALSLSLSLFLAHLSRDAHRSDFVG